jgi:hypothetical protein
MRLGGWLRLWVVLVMLYGLVVAAFTLTFMPTEGRLAASWSMTQSAGGPAWRSGKRTPGAPWDGLDAKLEDADRRIQQEHEEQVRDLSKNQRRAIGIALAVWMVPALALLALGHAVAWVRRGFDGV